MALSRLKSTQILTRLGQTYACANRNFMSDTFQLQVEWNERLQDPIYSKISMDKYFLEIDRQYVKTGLISHIDLDIFANGVLLSKTMGKIFKPATIEGRFEQLEELLRRFRATPEAMKLMDSTTHAVMRGSIDVEQTDILMKFLGDRLKYGLILDDFSNVMLLNHFIKENNHRDAAKTGIFMMLQEEFQVPIATEMSLYATYNYIMDQNSKDLPWNPISEEVAAEPEEEVKIRVEEVENPDFDDHFDLVKKEHLLGKSLAYTAKAQKLGDSVIQKSLSLLGYTYFEKWEKVEEILSKNGEFAKDCLEESIRYANEVGNPIADKLQNATSVEVLLKEQLKSTIDYAIARHQDKYIEDQAGVYKMWNLQREKEFENYHQSSLEASKLQEIEQYKVKLQEEESKLYFFENYNQMEQEKRIKYLNWRKTFPSRKGWGQKIKMGIRDPNVPLVTRKDRQAAKKK